MRKNQYGQPIGDSIAHHFQGSFPKIDCLEGKYCLLEPINISKYGAELAQLYLSLPEESLTYLPISPFKQQTEVEDFLEKMEKSQDPYYLLIKERETGRVLGTFALMRNDRANRVIEVGWIVYSPAIQRTRMATEAQYLLARYVFETLGYRRYEWKCDCLNAASRRAAERLGFQYEGTFRQALVYKGRNRDTAWFSMLDSEWPERKSALESWLAQENFDQAGRQIQALEDFR